MFDQDNPPFVRSDEIPWGNYSTPQPQPTANAELISILLKQRHDDLKTIETLRQRITTLQEEIARYTRHAVQGSQRLYRKRPKAAPEADPTIASRGLGFKV